MSFCIVYNNFNCGALDCEFRYYKTGNIAEAWHKGERMSNSNGYRCKAAKSYIDVKTGEAKSTQAYLQVSLDERLAEALATNATRYADHWFEEDSEYEYEAAVNLER